MKPIAEIADEYERNLIPLRERRDAVKAQAKAEPSAERRCRLWRRAALLDAMLYDGALAIHIMRRGSDGK